MKHLIKTVSFIAVMSVIPGAFAATSRASVIGKSASRLPSIAGYITPVSSASSSSSSSAASLLSNSECIEAYKSCINGSDACGADFEECTTNVLFHAQMPKCLSVLAQCSASGINDLFGTSSVTALSDVAEKNTYGEVTRYTYPTNGSVLGQMIEGAAIANKYDTQQCVKRYTSCLKKENVCGSDFELCTTGNEFKKQAIYCASTLARCQGDAITELYGSTNTSVPPTSNSRLGMMIADGAELAAANAVSTCYKVADQCILNACGANPAQCTENAAMVQIKMIDAINNGTVVAEDQMADWAGNITKSEVNKYIKNMCQETIGGNKYCYMTSELGNGKTPKASDLTDEDNREMVFSDIYASRMNSAMKQRLQSLLDKFDEKNKEKCVNTIKTCAMRSCGGGVGSVCYSEVFKHGKGSINGKNTYDEIKLACESIVNTDPTCQYAAASTNNAAYMYTYTDNNTFTTLFPEEEVGTDPIGVVAALNASLSTSYNEAAIANMRKQCSNTAVSCVKSMCGKDYVNCYRNRTDVMSNTYKTESESFNKSMNKVGGVLDYTIVTGLCINTVKNSKVCEEHLKIESVKLKKKRKAEQASWGGDVRSDWLGAAGSMSVTESQSDITVGCRTATDGCDNSLIDACDSIDEDGCLYDQPVTQAWTEYLISQSANNLFQEVLMDIEKEAQAKYNAKLTKEQHICLSQNAGGIMGTHDMGSTYKWVKLKSNKIPKNYSMRGLTTNQFVTSNDLYGSFCVAKVTLHSQDAKVRDLLGENSDAYFAVGDSFDCGSWLSSDELNKIANEIGKEKSKNEGVNSWKGKVTMLWTALGGAAVGGAAGGLIADSIQGGGKLCGLIKCDDSKTKYSDKTNAGSCVNNLRKCVNNKNMGACRSGMNDAIAANIEVPAGWQSDLNGGYVCTAQDVLDMQDVMSKVNKTCPVLQDGSNKEDPTCVNEKTDAASRLKTYTADKQSCYGRRSGETVGVGYLADTSKFEQVLVDCTKKADADYKDSRATNVGVGATLGALAVGGLGAGIAATALEAKKRSVKDKAIKEFLETIGDKVQCYVGAQELASFGDTVALTMEE